jgi:hypothetical protein
LIAGPAHQPERDFAATVAHNFLITPRLINELRIGASDVRILTSTDVSAKDIATEIGVPLPDLPGGNATPTFLINGFQTTATATSSVSRSRTIQLMDNLSWSAGAHSLKFGGDVRGLSAYFSNVFATSRVGQYTFNGSVTNSIVRQSLRRVPAWNSGHKRNRVGESRGLQWPCSPLRGYSQDDWKPSTRLTVNFG